MTLSKEAIEEFLISSFGRPVTIYEETDSTNDAAKRLAREGAPHGAAVLARQQTAGKGRLGRSFFSPLDSGLYLSVILRPALSPEAGLLITSAAAVATARAIERAFGISVKIKWVNDLYLDGKKLCGILAESGLRPGGGLDYIVLGIGVNLTTDAFPPEVADRATALFAPGDSRADPNRLAAGILNELSGLADRLEERSFLEEYRARSCVLGKTVQVLGAGESYEALACGIDNDAHLVVRVGESERVIQTGDVSIRGDFL